VRAFTEGVVQYVDLKEMGVDEKISRWQSFLSVPVFLESPSYQIPVGVVVLSSTMTKARSRVPRTDIVRMKELTAALKNLGHDLLDPSTMENLIDQSDLVEYPSLPE
jgi:hypothetical protein